MLTLVEGSFVALFFALYDNDDENLVWTLCLFIFSGIFNVDMNMALLTFFQSRFNVVTPLSKKLAKASYTVYLVHPFIVTCLTALYIQIYNLCADNLVLERIDDDDTLGDSGISDWGFIIGFVLICFFTHAIVWPLSVWISGLPVLKEYL